MLPTVPYDSYEEFEMLRAELMKSYTVMVNDGLEICKDKLTTWFECHEGPSMGVLTHWESEGLVLWMRLTKGYGKELCEWNNHALLCALQAVCKTACTVHKHLLCSRKRMNNEQIYNLLHPILASTIASFIMPDYSPNQWDAFENANFKWDDNEQQVPLVKGAMAVASSSSSC